MSNALDPIIRNQRGLRRLMDKVREENTMVELGVGEGDRGGLDQNQVIKRFQRCEDKIANCEKMDERLSMCEVLIREFEQ